MIELPFGNGVTAALVFLIFELLAFPVLIDATSKAASLCSHKLAKRDKSIRVKSLSYPLWNEGLFNRQLSHALLFLLRMVCIAIPVYLETRLDFRDHHHLVTKRVQSAFVTEPRMDWLEYSNQENDSLFDLRDQAELVFDRCSFRDDDGWLTASIGNVTYSSTNKLLFINCVEGTSKQVYRTKGELPGEVDLDFLLSGKLKPGDLNGTASLSFVEGPLSVIVPSLEEDFLLPSDIIVQAKGVDISVANSSGFECFLPTFSTLRSTFWGTFFQFLCHNMNGNVIDYYYVVTEPSLSEIQNSSRGETPNIYDVVIGPLDVVLQKMGTFEFREKVLLSAEHVVNQGIDYSMPGSLDGLSGTMRRILYTRSDNVSVSVPGEEVTQRTVLDEVIIIIGAIEVGAILAFGLAMQLCFTYRWKHIQRPNTVDGLSQCWARSITGGERKHKAVTLRWGQTISNGMQRMVLEPVTVHAQDAHEGDG